MANHCRPMAETVGFEPTDRLITDQTISSRSRYDHFDTSPCCIPNALQVSRRSGTGRRNRRQRKTVDIQLLEIVDKPKFPEVSRVCEDVASTDRVDFERVRAIRT